MRKTLAITTLLFSWPFLTPPVKAPAAPPPPPLPRPVVLKSWSGWASWYGPGFEGRTMANGKPYDPAELTVAHPSLPLGTWVRITNLSNHRQAFARVTDRGPYMEGREMDVSVRVARRLNITGVSHVKIEIIRFADGTLNYFLSGAK